MQTLAGKQVQTARQSNFELLRIIAMFLIVAYHFSIHGGFDFATSVISVNRLWTQFIRVGGKIGVDIFILISGYFLVQAQRFKFKKILKLWLMLFFYSFLIYIIFVGVGLEDFSFKALIKSILPVTFEQWWFASAYFVLYLLSPFINTFLKKLDKKTYQKIIILLTFCWCLIPTFTNQEFQGNNLLFFIYLYAIAAYVRLWGKETGVRAKTYLSIAALLTLLTFLSAVLFDLLGMKISFFGEHATHFYGMQYLPIVFISLMMFLGFKKIDLGSSKKINFISSAMFGVYLIHDHVLMRSFLWKNLFKNADFTNSVYLIPYSILIISLVFVFCTAIELGRIHIIENNYMKQINKIEQPINTIIHKFFSLKFFDKW